MTIKKVPIASSFTLLLLMITLSFGGVHPPALSAALAGLLALAGVSLLIFPTQIDKFDGRYVLFFTTACLLIGYIAFQPMLLVNSGHQQPFYSLYSRIRLPAFLALVSLLTAFLLSSRAISQYSLHKAFIWIGTIISTIALAHWLGDNGKLFFLFEPEHLVITNRARWPFVNPNHLACFLLIPLALGLFILEKEAYEISIVFQNEMNKKNFQFVHFIGTSTGQRCCAQLIRSLLPVIVMSLALVASQSRNGLFCLALLLAFVSVRALFGDKSVKNNPQSVKTEIVDLHELQLIELQQIKKKKNRSFHPAALLPLILLITLSLLLFAFSPDATDILSDRATYSLSNTRDDARFALYRESAQLLHRSPLFGLGGHNWQHIFPSILINPIPGIQPRYLHSDPYQFFLEYGLIGSALCVLLFILTLRATAHSWSSLSGYNKVGLSYAVVALVLFIVFSLFDFPFHIPAVAAGFAILLTSLYFYRSDLT